MTTESSFDQMRAARLDAIEKDLSAWANADISFDFDPSGTDLFSIMELALAYAKRCSELRDSIHLLLKAGKLVSASVIARAMIETIGIGCSYINDMLKFIERGDRPKLEERLKRYYQGQKEAELQPVHVMDGLRYLDEIDAAYVTYLSSKYEILGKIFAAMKAGANVGADVTLQEAVSVMKNYAFLCEVTHPNGIGTQFLFPHDPIDTESIDKVRQRLHNSCLVAIWHAHFLVEHLERGRSIPSKFKEAFLTAPGSNTQSAR